MSEKVDIVYAHHYGDHVPEERATVDVDEGRRLVQAGVANYATKAEATRVEGDAGADKTARGRGRPS